jgi:hypothetical protein
MPKQNFSTLFLEQSYLCILTIPTNNKEWLALLWRGHPANMALLNEEKYGNLFSA